MIKLISLAIIAAEKRGKKPTEVVLDSQSKEEFLNELNAMTIQFTAKAPEGKEKDAADGNVYNIAGVTVTVREMLTDEFTINVR